MAVSMLVIKHSTFHDISPYTNWNEDTCVRWLSENSRWTGQEDSSVTDGWADKRMDRRVNKAIPLYHALF